MLLVVTVLLEYFNPMITVVWFLPYNYITVNVNHKRFELYDG